MGMVAPNVTRDPHTGRVYLRGTPGVTITIPLGSPDAPLDECLAAAGVRVQETWSRLWTWNQLWTWNRGQCSLELPLDAARSLSRAFLDGRCTAVRQREAGSVGEFAVIAKGDSIGVRMGPAWVTLPPPPASIYDRCRPWTGRDAPAWACAWIRALGLEAVPDGPRVRAVLRAGRVALTVVLDVARVDALRRSLAGGYCSPPLRATAAPFVPKKYPA